MHIAMVHRDLHQRTRGGICAIYRSLATHMTARGHTVTLITQQSPHPVTVDGARVVTLPRTENMTAHRASVAAVLDRIRPDVIDCSTWEAETLTYLHQLPEYRAPVLVRGEFSARTLGADDLAAAEHELVHLADRVIAVSHYASRDLADAYHIETPVVIHNGIDRDRFTPGPATWPNSGLRIHLDRDGQPSDPEPIPALLASTSPLPPFTADPRHRQRLVWVGKITPMKGWDRLEQIAARLHDIAVITVVLGHSRAFCPVSEHARHLVVVHDLDDADMPVVYRSADWLLSTSRWEGFGLAIAEALACGTPVLLPDTLGTAPELLAAGGGYTYRDPSDLIDILAACPPPVSTLPTTFDWEINTTATLAHYQQLIGARPCAYS